jgi:peptide/nickel transport system permease protein
MNDTALIVTSGRSGLAGKVAYGLEFMRRWPTISIVILIVAAFAAITATTLAPHNPRVGDLDAKFTPPIWSEGGSGQYVLGTDHLGRDIFSRLMFGARVSLSIAAVSVFIGGAIGVVTGLISGYYGGWVDDLIMRVVDIFLAFPLILLALVLVVAFGDSVILVTILLVSWVWTSFARQVRGETLQLKELEYVKLARVAGATTLRIIFRHIFPGTVSTTLVIGSLRVGFVILVEASLSFLGAGVPVSTPTWGSMTSDGRQYIENAWWISFMPGMAILLVVVAANFLGDWMRDRLDPRLRQI